MKNGRKCAKAQVLVGLRQAHLNVGYLNYTQHDTFYANMSHSKWRQIQKELPLTSAHNSADVNIASQNQAQFCPSLLLVSERLSQMIRCVFIKKMSNKDVFLNLKYISVHLFSAKTLISCKFTFT